MLINDRAVYKFFGNILFQALVCLHLIKETDFGRIWAYNFSLLNSFFQVVLIKRKMFTTLKWDERGTINSLVKILKARLGQNSLLG